MAQKGLVLAERMGRLKPYLLQKMFARAEELERGGREVIHLEFGEPDFATPDHVVQAADQAIKSGYTRYTSSAGILKLREAIAERLEADHSLKYDPANQIVVTPGSKHALFSCVLAMINPGDEVIIPNPCFPAFDLAVRLAGGNSVPIILREELDFQLDLKELKRQITPRTKMLIINSPHNPTGSVLSEASLAEMADIAKRHNLVVLSDEVYDKFVYDGFQHQSIAGLPGMAERTVVINSFSKRYAMSGWRLGYAAGPASLIQAVRKVQEGSTTCAVAFCQMAGIEALKDRQNDTELMREEFDRRRVLLVQGLNDIEGVRCPMPKGAFFAFANTQGVGIGSLELSQYLLEEASVVTVPGDGFGSGGEGYLRFSYANSAANIEKALKWIKKALGEIRRGK
ncbi:MAG: pyridoxal phosphate-dependent aminotransferase [Thermodesulfobacteriota bacterium]